MSWHGRNRPEERLPRRQARFLGETDIRRAEIMITKTKVSLNTPSGPDQGRLTCGSQHCRSLTVPPSRLLQTTSELLVRY